MRKSPRSIECCAVIGPKSQGETASSPTHFLFWLNCKSKQDRQRECGITNLCGSSSRNKRHLLFAGSCWTRQKRNRAYLRHRLAFERNMEAANVATYFGQVDDCA